MFSGRTNHRLKTTAGIRSSSLCTAMRNVSSQRSTTAFTTSPLRDRKADSVFSATC